MKKQILTMFTGLFIGAIITGGASAYAAGILAERSNHRIFVDGQEVQMEAYAINGNNYVKLRDIGEQVGFNVYWDSDTKCVQVESEKPYTGEAPEKSAEVKPITARKMTTHCCAVPMNARTAHTASAAFLSLSAPATPPANGILSSKASRRWKRREARDSTGNTWRLPAESTVPVW